MMFFKPLSLTLLLDFCLGVLAAPRNHCDSFFGMNVNPDDCMQALRKLWLTRANTKDVALRKRAFSRANTADPSARMPQGFAFNSCSLGVDLTEPRQPVVITDWMGVILNLESLIQECAGAQPVAFGGWRIFGDLVVVVGNHRTLELRNTCLDPVEARANNALVPFRSLSLDLQFRATTKAKMVAENLWSQGQRFSIVPSTPKWTIDEGSRVQVRIQGPFLLSKRDSWYLLEDWRQSVWPVSGEWMVFRGLKPLPKSLPSTWFPLAASAYSTLDLGMGIRRQVSGLWRSEGIHWIELTGRINLAEVLIAADWVLVKTIETQRSIPGNLHGDHPDLTVGAARYSS